MAAVPPLSPVLAPKGHRKRRHSQMSAGGVQRDSSAAPILAVEEIRLSATPGVAQQTLPENSTSPHSSTASSVGDESEDGDDDDDNELTSSVEDLLDRAEEDPYLAFLEGEQGLSAEDAARLRARLLDIGPDEFVRETLVERGMDPRMLGTAFGIDPRRTFAHDDARFMRVLQLAIVRTFIKRRKLMQFNTIDDAVELLQKSKKIMVITGAGISTSLGIPDFRSKDGGFYTMLLKEGYDDPEAVFDIHTFDSDPRLFYKLAGNILPDMKRISPTHAFIRLLQDKGKLQRNYSQNIDALEQLAGIKDELLVQCHGSFATATCRNNRTHKVKGTEIYADIKAQQVAYCQRCKEELAQQALQRHHKPSNTKRRRFAFEDFDEDSDDDIAPGVMKPDITFFGEQLPDTFFDLFTSQDIKDVDLVLVIGTSLKVAPVSEMPHHLPPAVPHIYISREPIEHVNFDIQLLGNCDDVVFELCRRAGWNFKHEMIRDDFRVRVEPWADSTYRWKVISRPPKEHKPVPKVGNSAHASSPGRTASPARLTATSRSSAEPIQRTASPIKPPAMRLSATGTPPPRVDSPSKPTFRPIPGSASRPLSLTPTPPPPSYRPIPGSPSRRPVSTPTPPPQGIRPIPGSPSRLTHLKPAGHAQSVPRSSTPTIGISSLSALGAAPVGSVPAAAGVATSKRDTPQQSVER